MTAWKLEEATRCPRCGTFDWEWEEDPDAWEGDHWRCHGCQQLDYATETIRNIQQDTYGYQPRLFKKPDGLEGLVNG